LSTTTREPTQNFGQQQRDNFLISRKPLVGRYETDVEKGPKRVVETKQNQWPESEQETSLSPVTRFFGATLNQFQPSFLSDPRDDNISRSTEANPVDRMRLRK
jgi:hypothetical protein